MLSELAAWLTANGPVILVGIIGVVLLVFFIGLFVDAVWLERGEPTPDEPPTLDTRGPDDYPPPGTH